MVTVAMKLRHLLLGRKAMTNPDSILKSRDITLSTEVHLAKAMVFFIKVYCQLLSFQKKSFIFKCWKCCFMMQGKDESEGKGEKTASVTGLWTYERAGTQSWWWTAGEKERKCFLLAEMEGEKQSTSLQYIVEWMYSEWWLLLSHLLKANKERGVSGGLSIMESVWNNHGNQSKHNKAHLP